MKVSELGEFGLIRLLTGVIEKAKNPGDTSWQNLLIGIGDDTAAWKSDDPVQLATTDCLIQDIHFDLSIGTWDELGWKAIAVNLSDIAAMGGIPRYALVSLALPGHIEVDCISNLYQGMMEASNQFGVAIAGGNISSANKVMISITLMGILNNRNALMRSTARFGDQIAITGNTGLSAAGLQMLRKNLKFDTETSSLFRKAHLKPVPRVNEGQILLHYGVKTAIDISDGLIADLSHICEASRVSATVSYDRVPIHSALQAHFKDSYQHLALSGGEDYELLFTATGQVVEEVKKALSCPVTVIGEITGGTPWQVTLVNFSGDTIPLQQAGWEHFKSKA